MANKSISSFITLSDDIFLDISLDTTFFFFIKNKQEYIQSLLIVLYIISNKDNK